MPLAMNPNESFKYVLVSDRQVAESVQPYFELRFMSVKDWLAITKIAELIDAPEKIEQIEQAQESKEAKRAVAIEKAKEGFVKFDDCVKVLTDAVIGWGNMTDRSGEEIPFDIEKLTELLCLKELYELFGAFQKQGIEAKDLKNSDTPSDSDSAASAISAEDPGDAQSEKPNKQ